MSYEHDHPHIERIVAVELRKHIMLMAGKVAHQRHQGTTPVQGAIEDRICCRSAWEWSLFQVWLQCG